MIAHGGVRFEVQRPELTAEVLDGPVHRHGGEACFQLAEHAALDAHGGVPAPAVPPLPAADGVAHEVEWLPADVANPIPLGGEEGVLARASP